MSRRLSTRTFASGYFPILITCFFNGCTRQREEVWLKKKWWDTSLLHIPVNTGARRACTWCAYLRKEADPSKRDEHASKQTPRTPYQCSQCAVHLRIQEPCFEDYYRAPAEVSEVSSEGRRGCSIHARMILLIAELVLRDTWRIVGLERGFS